MTLVAERCWLRGEDGALVHYDVREAPDAKGAILTVPGLGEHVGKYAEWLEAARADGWSAVAIDPRGHGRTPGPRGDFTIEEWTSDLERMVAVLSDRDPGAPIFVFGHSLGALAAIRAAQAGSLDGVAGIVLSAPPIELVRVYSRGYRGFVRALGRIAPGAPLRRAWDPAKLTRDPERVRAMRADLLIHRRLTPRAMVSAAAAMEAARERPDTMTRPVLLLLPEEDLICSTPATVEWAARLGARDVTALRVRGGYHEVLQDLGRGAAYRKILDWCDGRALRLS